MGTLQGVEQWLWMKAWHRPFQDCPSVIKLGAGLRLCLLLFGLAQDALSPVKYTDIDYEVYTDAAAYVARGQTPYARSTYRYTPLLAFLLLPNVWVHKCWGKVVFCTADLVAAW